MQSCRFQCPSRSCALTVKERQLCCPCIGPALAKSGEAAEARACEGVGLRQSASQTSLRCLGSELSGVPRIPTEMWCGTGAQSDLRAFMRGKSLRELGYARSTHDRPKPSAQLGLALSIASSLGCIATITNQAREHLGRCVAAVFLGPHGVHVGHDLPIHPKEPRPSILHGDGPLSRKTEMPTHTTPETRPEESEASGSTT